MYISTTSIQSSDHLSHTLLLLDNTLLLQMTAPNIGSRPSLNSIDHTRLHVGLKSNIRISPAQSLRNRRDERQAKGSTAENVSIPHKSPTRHIQRILEVRIPRKVIVLPDRKSEEQLMIPPSPKYQQLVDRHRYRLGSARFRFSRQIGDDECWCVLLHDTEVMGPHGCLVALGTTSWRYPFGSALNPYRVHRNNRKSLNQQLEGEILYTHAAMNVMSFRYALKFTTIVGDVRQQHEVSHLCGYSHCYRPTHLVLDSHRVNLLRSRCRGCSTDKRGAQHNYCPHADLPGSGGQHCSGHEQCPEYCPERLKRKTSRFEE